MAVLFLFGIFVSTALSILQYCIAFVFIRKDMKYKLHHCQEQTARVESLIYEGFQPMMASRLLAMSYLIGWANEIALSSLIIEMSMPRRRNSSMSAWS